MPDRWNIDELPNEEQQILEKYDFDGGETNLFLTHVSSVRKEGYKRNFPFPYYIKPKVHNAINEWLELITPDEEKQVLKKFKFERLYQRNMFLDRTSLVRALKKLKELEGAEKISAIINNQVRELIGAELEDEPRVKKALEEWEKLVTETTSE